MPFGVNWVNTLAETKKLIGSSTHKGADPESSSRQKADSWMVTREKAKSGGIRLTVST